ncbi:MAG: hypothetical protein ACT4OS_10570 [Acidimicrobiales bacterium]
MREQDLRAAAEADAGFVAVMLDLGERGGPVVVTSVRGTTHAGQVMAVGDDFAALRTMGDRIVLLAYSAIADVSPSPTTRSPSLGKRGVLTLGVHLSDVMASAAGHRSRVSIHCGERVINGDAYAAGRDVLTVLAPGPPPRPSYVYLASITEVALLDHG